MEKRTRTAPPPPATARPAQVSPSEWTARTATAPDVAPAPWTPPAGTIVTDDRTFLIWRDGQRFEHVADAPDGRWVYRAS